MSDAGYNSKSSQYYTSARPEMLQFVPADTKTVLEVGCGGADFAALLKAERGVNVTAIEAYPAAAEVARSRVDRLLAGSLEDSLRELAGERFDCIVMNDVLEHLVDPWAALRGLAGVLAPSGSFVASIPNVRYMPVFKEYLLEGQWRYRSDGVMDETHLRFFSASSMRDLFSSSGYRVVRHEGINPTKFPWKFALLNRLMGGSLADTRFKQFACVAVPAAA